MRTARTRLAGLAGHARLGSLAAPLALALALAPTIPVLAACGSDTAPASALTDDSGAATPSPRADGGGDTSDGDAGASTDGGDGGDGGASGPPPSSLPVTFQRPDVGTPLTPAEIDTATTELIAILKGTRYFDLVDERVHGWPETDPSKSYWYGHWWSGITVTKSGSTVTFRHSHDGADNNGIQSAPYLEGACYGYLMWGDPKVGHLARRMARAYTAWIKAMVRSQGDTNPTLLSRAFYHPNVTSNEGGRTTLIDYSQTYPGIDADPSEYVHIPTNPTFGDIWIKNKRSKDDIGQILRSISQFLTCGPRFDAAGQADAAELKALYTSWAKAVDANGFGIQTLDKSGNLWTPPDQLAHYSLIANLECLGALAVRLRGGNAPGNVSCGTGFPTTESLAWNFLKNDARQIVRTNHAAAILLAYEQNQLPVASELLEGEALERKQDKRVPLAHSLVRSHAKPSPKASCEATPTPRPNLVRSHASPSPRLGPEARDFTALEAGSCKKVGHLAGGLAHHGHAGTDRARLGPRILHLGASAERSRVRESGGAGTAGLGAAR